MNESLCSERASLANRLSRGRLAYGMVIKMPRRLTNTAVVLIKDTMTLNTIAITEVTKMIVNNNDDNNPIEKKLGSSRQEEIAMHGHSALMAHD